MTYPLSRLEVSIQAASSDGLFYGRFPHGDKPVSSLTGLASDATTASGALSTAIKLGGAAVTTTSAQANGLILTLTPLWTDPLSQATQNVPYSYQLSAKGGTAPYFYSLQAGFTLPAGLSLVGDTITGTPTTPVSLLAENFIVTDSAP